MLRTIRLIYFRRDNNKTVYNACAKLEPQAVITLRDLVKLSDCEKHSASFLKVMYLQKTDGLDPSSKPWRVWDRASNSCTRTWLIYSQGHTWVNNEWRKKSDTYFSYKHLLYKNQINNSWLKAIYLSVISSYKVNNGWRKRRAYLFFL